MWYKVEAHGPQGLGFKGHGHDFGTKKYVYNMLNVYNASLRHFW